MTEYVILKWNEANQSWKEHGSTTSSSPERAVRTNAYVIDAGKYVAVPKRSWKPLPVKIEQVSKVTVG
jgi:hypothetical protein